MWFNTGHTLIYETKSRSSIALAGVGYTLPAKQGLFVESSATLSDSTAITIEGGYTKTFTTFQLDLYALKNVTTPESWQLATGIGWKFR